MAASTPRFAAELAVAVIQCHHGDRDMALASLVAAVAVVCEGSLVTLEIALAALGLARDIAAKRAAAAVTQPIEVLS